MKHRYILLLFAVMLGICFFLFSSFYDQAKQEAIKNINNEQLLHARQAARGIEDFFDNWMRALNTLAQSDPVINMDKAGREDIGILFRVNQDKIRAITRVDAEGRIIFTVPLNRDVMGRNISNQDHIREIMGTHKPVVSNVFSAVQGYETIALHVPVFRNKIYQGSIGIAINFQALAKRYLEDIKIGNTGYAWMISRDGTELYCPVPGHTGKSVFENCKDFPSILVMAEDMLKGNRGLTTYTFDKIRGNKIEVVEKYAVYMPINLGNTFWSIVVASSEDEIIASLKGFRNKLIVVIAFLLLGSVLFAYYGLKAWFIVGEEKKRLRTEEELQKSEERFRSLFLQAPVGIFIYDNTLKVVECNEHFGKIVRSSWENIIGLDLLKLRTKDVIPYLEAALANRNSHYEGEYLPLTSEELVWVSFNVSPLHAADGRVIGGIGVAEDVTERKLAETALQESEEKYRIIADNTADIISVMDMKLRFTYISPSIKRIRGFTVEEAMGQTLDQIMTPESRVNVLKVFAEEMKLEAGGTADPDRIRTLEVEEYRQDGTTFWVEVVMSLLRDKDRRPVRILAVSRDINRRKEVELALRKEQEFTQLLFDTSPAFIVAIGFGGETIMMNKAMLNSLEYTEEEIKGTGYLTKFVAEEDREMLTEVFQKIVREGKETVNENRIRSKSGRVYIVEWHGRPIIRQEKGNSFFVGVGIDISERKRAQEEARRLEERLSRAEKMEALGTLAGGVAHDLNNVLGVVVGYAELLINSVDASSPLRPRLLNIMNGGERAAAIVQDLLTLARRGVPTRQVLNLNNIIVDVQQSPEFGSLSSHHPFVRINIDLDPELLNISGSPVHLGKTIFNLAANASEAMPDGGVLSIKTTNQYLDKPIHGYDDIREGDYVVLSVTDTGEGIPAADLKRIFEPFYTKKVMGRSGTGLGLAVVWGTVKDHQGYVNVESEVGKGSIFSLYFPVTRAKISADRVAVGIREYAGKGESVLIVDDVKGQRDLAAEMLSEINYNVTTVASGEEAMAYLKEHAVDLLVLDMIMDPGMDGMDTYRSILTIRPQQKAIIVSGFSETYRVNAAQALGAGQYVRKPYIIETLGLAVRKELDR